MEKQRGENESYTIISSPVNLPDILIKKKENKPKHSQPRKRGEPPHITLNLYPVNLPDL